MKVRAKQMGFYGGARRRVGEVFEIPDGATLGKWMEPVDNKAKVGPAPAKVAGPPKTDTLSQMARRAEPRPAPKE